VAKFDSDGNWVMSWGQPGTGPGEFHLPHAIVIDKDDNLYVGDRTNQRVQVFDTGGKFLREWKVVVPPDYTSRAVNGPTPKAGDMSGVGAPNSLCITPPRNQLLFLGESTWPGRIFKVSLDGKVLGVIGRSGRRLKEFSGVHALACPSDREIYAAETSNWRVQKLLLHDVARSQ
jgi:sugar lactone lactonase YvrE